LPTCIITVAYDSRALNAADAVKAALRCAQALLSDCQLLQPTPSADCIHTVRHSLRHVWTRCSPPAAKAWI